MGPFLINLIKKLLTYLVFILPVILLFKASYSCMLDSNYSMKFFNQHFISNVPLFGKALLEFFWKDDILLSNNIIYVNQQLSGLLLIGTMGSYFAWSLLPFIQEYLEFSELKNLIPLTLNMGDGSGSGSGSGQPYGSGEGSSKSAEQKQEGRVITDSDYEDANSVSSDGEDYKALLRELAEEMDNHDPNENIGSRLLNAPNFHKEAEKYDAEQLAQGLNELEEAKERLESDQDRIPGAKIQLPECESRIMLTIEEIERRLSEGESKGKEKEIISESKPEGKGKEK